MRLTWGICLAGLAVLTIAMTMKAARPVMEMFQNPSSVLSWAPSVLPIDSTNSKWIVAATLEDVPCSVALRVWARCHKRCHDALSQFTEQEAKKV